MLFGNVWTRVGWCALALAVVGGFLLLRLMIREMRGRTFTAWQWVFWWMAYYLVRVQWRCRDPHRIDLPTDGRGIVFVCNHRSSIDPFFIEILPDKAIRWMVAAEYMSHPIFGFFLKRCDVIPARRGGVDNAATRMAIDVAANGGYVGMFPEGRVNQTDDFMLSVRPGAILVALKANAWIVPVYIDGSPFNGTPWSPLFMRARAQVHIGEPIDVAPYVGQHRDSQVVKDLLVQSVQEIARLAGRPDFQPVLAGRRWRDENVENVQQAETDGNTIDEHTDESGQEKPD